jgi:hypothetical protein
MSSYKQQLSDKIKILHFDTGVQALQKFSSYRFIVGESNGKLPLRTCPGCSVPEPYRSPDWALVPAKLAQGLNTINNKIKRYIVMVR